MPLGADLDDPQGSFRLTLGGGAVRVEQLVGAEVSRVAFSYQVELLFLSGARVVIETEFSTRVSDGRQIVLDPENMTTHTDVVVGLLRAIVVECTISATGTLVVMFSTGVSIVVEPSPSYEAFNIHFPGSPSRVLSTPGGSLEWWD
jgi:hypothetical protein